HSRSGTTKFWRAGTYSLRLVRQISTNPYSAKESQYTGRGHHEAVGRHRLRTGRGRSTTVKLRTLAPRSIQRLGRRASVLLAQPTARQRIRPDFILAGGQ